MHNILIFDLETTCWSTDYPVRNPEIIEFGGLLLNAFGDELDRWETFVRPEEHPYLSTFCIHLTGIEQENVDSGLSFPIFHKRWLSWMDQWGPIKNYVAWGGYDLKVWQAQCMRHDVEGLDHVLYLDLKKAYHEINGLQEIIGLKKAHRREGLRWEGPIHRAMSDAEHLADVYRRHLGSWPM